MLKSLWKKLRKGSEMSRKMRRATVGLGSWRDSEAVRGVAPQTGPGVRDLGVKLAPNRVGGAVASVPARGKTVLSGGGQ